MAQSKVIRLKGLLPPHAAKFGGTSGAPGDFFVAQDCLRQAGLPAASRFEEIFNGHFRRDPGCVGVHLKPTL
jgi:hypothetical protein